MFSSAGRFSVVTGSEVVEGTTGSSREDSTVISLTMSVVASAGNVLTVSLTSGLGNISSVGAAPEGGVPVEILGAAPESVGAAGDSAV